MKIVVAFDSFKDCMSAASACRAAKLGVQDANPEAEIIELPLADGGEGTTAILAEYLGAIPVVCAAHDALMRPIMVHYAISSDGQTAIMDMASAAGLMQIEHSLRDTKRTCTYGVGEMIKDAYARGCTHILIGIGGSATTDGGCGMLAALGTQFYDDNHEVLIPTGENLSRIAQVHYPTRPESMCIEVLCDVNNPLYGPQGAAYVYAPQKSATAEDVVMLDEGLKHWAIVSGHPELAQISGSGAAGGLGFGLLLFGAHLRRGIDVVLSHAQLQQSLCGADLVITGEGKIDRQSLYGKLPYGVLCCAEQAHVPTAVLAGMVQDADLLKENGFWDVRSINTDAYDLSYAMKPENAMHNLRHAARKLIQDMY